jgi:hypothetical protein
LTKSEKVKLLARWTAEFPDLLTSARRGQMSPSVARDIEADLLYGQQRDSDIYVLPDDNSGMPSYFCKVDTMKRGRVPSAAAMPPRSANAT